MLGRYHYSPAMTEIIQTIIDGKWSSMRYEEILSEYKVRSNSVEFKKESLDVAIQYAILCLEDDALSEDEIKGMYMLKRLLYIEEGDFYKYDRKQEVEGVLAAQLLKLYDDGEISYEEAIHKVDLQGLFNLSYEEFEDVVRDIAQTVYDKGADYFKLDTYSIKYKKDVKELRAAPAVWLREKEQPLEQPKAFSFLKVMPLSHHQSGLHHNKFQ